MNNKVFTFFIYSWITIVFGVYLLQFKSMTGSIIQKFSF